MRWFALLTFAAALCQLPAAAAQSPINFSFDIHVEPMPQIPLPQRQTVYSQWRAELQWLISTADATGAKLSLQSNGEYMEFCRELGQQSDFATMLTKGHDVGTHAHQVIQIGTHNWRDVNPPPWDTAMVERTWFDAKRQVDQVVPEAKNNCMCPQLWGPCAFGRSLMVKYHFTIRGAGADEVLNRYFGHMPWNPFAQGCGAPPFDEDLTNNDFIIVPHYPQIGAASMHGPQESRSFFDLRPPCLKKQIMLLYLEWLHRERTGAPDKVMAIGWCEHANMGTRYHSDITEMLNWINANFVGKTSARGNVIGRFATFSQIKQQYDAWHAANPGLSSFEFHDGEPYPYSLEPVARTLRNAAYDEAITTWRAQGVNCHKFTSGSAPVYVLWRDFGTTVIDASTLIPVRCTRTLGTTGSTTLANPATLVVSEEPIMIQPVVTGPIGRARLLPDYAGVDLDPAAAVAVFPGICYLEQPDRAAGIRVASLRPDIQLAGVYQALGWINTADGERRIEAVEVNEVLTFVAVVVKPLAVPNRDLSANTGVYSTGPPIVGGLTTQGMLVRTTGRVIELGSGAFYIEDGSRVPGLDGRTGVKVVTSMPVSVGRYVAVTGAASTWSPLSYMMPERALLTRSAEDVRVL